YVSSFYLQATEVTNGEMDAYFRDQNLDNAKRPERFQKAWDVINKQGMDPAKFPAVGIRHDLAEAYARWVGGKLPTEAQWEFAARSGGKPRRFVWADDDMLPTNRNANISSIGRNENLLTTEPRTYKKDVTEQGIFDMT